jgi:hypothetical protein
MTGRHVILDLFDNAEANWDRPPRSPGKRVWDGLCTAVDAVRVIGMLLWLLVPMIPHIGKDFPGETRT